jgi:CTP-dependent riboflavin kinase
MMEFLLKELSADRKTDREEMIARLDANQAKTDAALQVMQTDRKADREEVRAGQKQMITRMDANQAELRELKRPFEEKVNAAMQWRKKIDASHKEIVAKIKPERDTKTMAC